MGLVSSVITRRQFVVGAGATGLALLAGCGWWPWPTAPARSYRIGVLAEATFTTMASRYDALLQGLHDLGYVEGKNIIIEQRFEQDSDDQLQRTTAELVSLPVDVLVVPSAGNAGVAQAVTGTIPIVVVGLGPLLTSGLVDSLSRPGGNITGLTNPRTLSSKRVELIKQAIPSVTKVVVLWGATSGPVSTEYEYAARALGIDVHSIVVSDGDELEGIFDAAARAGVDAILAPSQPVISNNMGRIRDLAMQHRLPSMWERSELVAAGGLMSYAPSQPAQWHRAAYFVDRILKGANPADLPIEQPMVFDFVVNLKTARELGLTFPPEILLQVTEVIDQ